MKLIIEARLESGVPYLQREPIRLASIERPNDDLDRLGLSLEEDRELMAAALSAVVTNHVAHWLTTRDYCRNCCTPYREEEKAARKSQSPLFFWWHAKKTGGRKGHHDPRARTR